VRCGCGRVADTLDGVENKHGRVCAARGPQQKKTRPQGPGADGGTEEGVPAARGQDTMIDRATGQFSRAPSSVAALRPISSTM
jgi:hypothetical protein